jgi:uncharacterized membrane protein YbhN (UPF0104 family)
MKQFRILLKKIWPTLRIVLSVLLLLKAFSQIDWPHLQEALPKVQIFWLLIGLMFLVIGNACAGFRWGFLMQVGGIRQRMRQFIQLYFTGSLINQGLPTTIGGDSYRAVAAIENPASKNGERDLKVDFEHAPPRLRKSFFIVGLDRTLGLAGNSLLGAIGLAVGGGVIGDWAPRLGVLLLAIMILGALGLATGLHYSKTRILVKKFLRKVGLQDALAVTRQAWGFPKIFLQLPFAIGIHLFTLASFWACLKAMGISAPLEALMIGMPALGLLLMLPISISGWGLRETTLAGMLSLWGLNPSLVVLSSILYGAITLITFLPGLPRLLKQRSSHRS